MDKPTKKYPIEECYDWHDIQSYIEDKYKCQLRGFAGRFGENPNDEAEYQDFWHFLTDACPGIANGTMFYMPERGSGDHEWQNKILGWIWDEFGDKAINGDEFDMPVWVSW